MSAIHFSHSARPTSERPSLEPGANGTWIDPSTGAEAVGARTVTLGDWVQPYEVAKPGERPEWVEFPMSMLARHEALAKLLAHPSAVQLNGGTETLLRLPHVVWEEVSTLAVGAWLPEIDGHGVTQSVAAVERRHRAAKRTLDDLTRDRTLVLLLATRAGRTRRELSEASGLSVARVQQLIEAPSTDMVDDLNDFLDRARTAFQAASGEASAAELAQRVGGDHAEELIGHLEALRLIASDGDRLTLTADGQAALSSEARKPSKARAKA